MPSPSLTERRVLSCGPGGRSVQMPRAGKRFATACAVGVWTPRVGPCPPDDGNQEQGSFLAHHDPAPSGSLDSHTECTRPPLQAAPPSSLLSSLLNSDARAGPSHGGGEV